MKIRETDIKDKRGNVVISQGLKVRHTSSQFEYTVDSVKKEPGGDITVMLALPEEPRFVAKKNPPAVNGLKNDTMRHGRTSQRMRNSDVLYEADPVDDLSSHYFEPDDEKAGDLLAIPQKEFEEDYEIR